MAHPAPSDDREGQQVMLAQATGPDVLEGEAQGPNYGSADALPNGVDRPAQSPGGIESLPWGSPIETRSSPISASRPELTLPVNTAASQPAGGIISGDVDLRSRSGGFGNQGAGDWPPALRWMSRLNDFFQRATGPVETFTTHTRQRLTGSRDGGLVVQQ